VYDNEGAIGRWRNGRPELTPGSTPLGLEEAHREFRIAPAEFEEAAAELGRTLDVFKVPPREKAELLAAFAAHDTEVTDGYVTQVATGG